MRNGTVCSRVQMLATPFLACCAILPSSFGGKGPDDIAQPSSGGLLDEVFISCKANARRSVHSPQNHFIITLIISEQRD